MCSPYQLCAHAITHRAVLQLALGAPSESLVAQHADSLQVKPDAVLVTREAKWPVCLSAILGPGPVTTCAVSSQGGGIAVSGSQDKTIK